MINKRESSLAHFCDFRWLQTYWLFSFGEYYDQDNLRHGALRVFNDDVVQPGRGFGEHPHEEMEIISIILQGEMVHKDSMGNEIVVKAGDVQRMSAGTGVRHSEWNNGLEPVHFYQLWLLPDKKGLQPCYDQRSFTAHQWHNKFTMLAGSNPDQNAVRLNTAGAIFRASVAPGEIVQFPADMSDKLFLYTIAGSAEINGVTVRKRDQLRISDVAELKITAQTEADLLLVQSPEPDTNTASPSL